MDQQVIFVGFGRSQGYNRSCRRSGGRSSEVRFQGSLPHRPGALPDFARRLLSSFTRASAVVSATGITLPWSTWRADRFTYRLVTQVAHCAFLFAPAVGLRARRCRLPPDNKPGLRLEA